MRGVRGGNDVCARVQDALRGAGNGLTPGEIADSIGSTFNTVYHVLWSCPEIFCRAPLMQNPHYSPDKRSKHPWNTSKVRGFSSNRWMLRTTGR